MAHIGDASVGRAPAGAGFGAPGRSGPRPPHREPCPFRCAGRCRAAGESGLGLSTVRMKVS